MDMSILFPHLHINLDYVIKSVSIGNFEIAMYGICIAIGVVLGLLLVSRVAKKTGQRPEDYFDLAIFGVIFGVIGARIYYVIFSWDLYKDDLKSIFNLRQGGLAIYGGVIAAIIVTVVLSKIKKKPFFQLADTACVGLITGQICGRWGNFFNREAFGDYTDNIFAMQLPVSAVRSSDITQTLSEHIEVVDGISYIQVHPTFLYESVWNLALLVILLLTRRYIKHYGITFFIYLFGYGLGRAWIESLRTDQLLIPNTNVAVSQMLAIILVIVSAVMMIVLHKWGKEKQ
ncbi:prolipoprotein diacylglyceryl transferase [Eubacterium oxidoreducens]|uniref:Phosphatidylglycerol--prolipoprotein diacylglyceryl transferase n=1 Tax=Eubacterium oxidoreducens TaxID=1732 RepID=A0A1G6AGD6_EUBOX|nr:prolipoprotein diacylglyceryl transferase [Eubacterium oxidoreducens]SDB07153.1 phosphatidylglycerol:prolipoprotein diacylglycerol transferase [Eubacterium oxidoreducens]